MRYKFILALTATLGICATSAFAVPHFWVDATGSWFNAANWTPATVPGAGDSATIGANGFATTGTANINGALAQANNLFLGLDSGTSGTVDIFNGGALVLNGGAGNAFIGEAGTGLLKITQTSVLVANNVTVGDLTGSSGELDVRTLGEGVAVNNTTIGNNGTGRMEITGGGLMITTNNAFIGRAAGGVGTVLVDGGSAPAPFPSEWQVGNNLNVGDAGTGTLNVLNGGLVQDLNIINIGNQAGSNGLVVVRDTNAFRASELDAFGTTLRIGNAGTGELDIRGGGFVDVPTGNVFVGDAATGVGLVKVDGLTATTGNPSEFTINLGNLTVGNFGMGTIHITNGGLVDPFDAFIGRNVGSTGLVTVDGSNAFGSSSFRVAHNLFIGGNAGGPGGKGELDITNGGSVFVGNDMVVWGAPTNNRPSNGKLAIDHTYNLAVGGTSFFEGGTLQFLDNQVDFGPPHTVGGPGYVSGNPVVLGTLTGPVGMYVDTNNGTMPLFNIVGPGQSGFPRISELLTGPGGLTVFGGGDVFLTNNNTFTGLTNVSDDSFLFIDGSVAGNARVDVGSFLGGRFGGAGPVANVGGNLTVNGTFSPGDVIAHGNGVGDAETFVVGGNATFNPTSTYVAEVGNVDIGSTPQPGSDLLITVGTTTINPVGSTIIVPRLDNFQPFPTELLGGPPNGLAGEASETTVILTGGGRFNQFSTLIAENWPGLIQPVQDTDEPFVLEIKYVLHPFTSVPGLCDNEFRVAEALDTAVAELPINAVTFLGFIPIADLPHAFELIAPEEYASMYEMSFSHAIVQSDNLQRHMDDIHAGATGYCGPVVEVNPPPIQDKNVADKKEVAPAFVPAPENRWSIWVQGNGDFVDVKNGDECAHGYNIDNGSITVGMDYRVLPNLAVGVYGGYLGSNADLVNRGSINMAQGNVGGYATFSWNGFYIDASGGGGWSNYNTHRFALEAHDMNVFPFLDFGPFANGQTDGSEVDAMGAIGYDWHWDTGTKLGCLNVGPLVSIQYTDVSLDGFRERGSLLPLIFPDQDEDSVRLTAGGRASLDIKVNNGILLRPEVRCSWLHEFSDQEYPILARFLPTTPLFRADGPSVGSDGALLGAGMTVQFSPSFGIFAFYDGVFGRTNYDLNSASGGFRISF